MHNAPANNSWQRILECPAANATDRNNQLRFAAWILGWSISFVIATHLLQSDRELAAPLTGLLILLPNALGIPVLLSYLKFLRQTSEQVRKSQMEGLAIGFAVGVFGAWGYSLLQAVGAPAITPVDWSAIMMVSWALGQLYGQYRHRQATAALPGRNA